MIAKSAANTLARAMASLERAPDAVEGVTDQARGKEERDKDSGAHKRNANNFGMQILMVGKNCLIIIIAGQRTEKSSIGGLQPENGQLTE